MRARLLLAQERKGKGQSRWMWMERQDHRQVFKKEGSHLLLVPAHHCCKPYLYDVGLGLFWLSLPYIYISIVIVAVRIHPKTRKAKLLAEEISLHQSRKRRRVGSKEP
eukprot:34150-Pelagomonas_calceolata.AAC.3